MAQLGKYLKSLVEAEPELELNNLLLNLSLSLSFKAYVSVQGHPEKVGGNIFM